MYYSPAKIAAILGALLLAALLALPNILPEAQQTYLKDKVGLHPMTLGLDLQGGSNVLLEIDRKDLVDKLQQQVSSDIRGALREAKVGYSNVQKTANGVSVRVTKPEDYDKAKEALAKLQQPQGGGLFGNTAAVNLFDLTSDNGQFTLSVAEKGMDSKIADAMRKSLSIVERRINATGTKEPIIQQQGKERIVVQVPGAKNTDEIRPLLEGTAKLTFQLLCEEQETATNKNPPQDCVGYPTKEVVDKLIAAKKASGEKPTEAELKALPQLWVQTSSRATIDGADLTNSQSAFGQDNQPVVKFDFNTRGSKKLATLSADNIGKRFAIVLDNVVQSAPVFKSAIPGGAGEISGGFTVQEAGNNAIMLRSGALPAKLNIVEEQTVGPSLGSDSIKAGVLASIVGLIAVIIFVMLPYGFFGMVANIALLANLLLLIAIMSFFGFTLTLPGIAGIVLTLGMAVDSNVLIYERIREEWRNGRTAMNAIETGFKAALATVLDANITTLIAAVVLFGVGSGPVRGFAVTLAVGIITTLFTAFTLTRMIVSIWMRRTRPKEINL